MIVESRRYLLHPGKLPEYLACFGAQPAALALLLPRLRGFWFSESGTLNTVHHLWTYESRAERAAARASLAATPVMAEFFARVTPLLQRQSSEILTGELRDPAPGGAAGVFDRISVVLQPQAGADALAASISDRLATYFDPVAVLQRRQFEAAGPVRELQLFLRSDSLAQRETRWRAVDEQVTSLASSAMVAHLDCQLLLPSPFSPWR